MPTIPQMNREQAIKGLAAMRFRSSEFSIGPGDMYRTAAGYLKRALGCNYVEVFRRDGDDTERYVAPRGCNESPSGDPRGSSPAGQTMNGKRKPIRDMEDQEAGYVINKEDGSVIVLNKDGEVAGWSADGLVFNVADHEGNVAAWFILHKETGKGYKPWELAYAMEMSGYLGDYEQRIRYSGADTANYVEKFGGEALEWLRGASAEAAACRFMGGVGAYEPLNVDSSPVIQRLTRIKKIASGGQAEISIALLDQSGLYRLVAVKDMHAKKCAGPRELQQFRNEVSALSRLDHSHILKMLFPDADYERIPEEDLTLLRYFYAMQLVRGVDAKSLGDGLASADKLMGDIPAVSIALCAADALAYAHEKNMIHLDVKPANILIPYEKEQRALALAGSKLGDFGISSLSGTHENCHVGGTPGYASPEQVDRIKELGPKSDVFSLGLTLYTMATGRDVIQEIAGSREPREKFIATAMLNDNQFERATGGSRIDRALMVVISEACRVDASERPDMKTLRNNLARLYSGPEALLQIPEDLAGRVPDIDGALMECRRKGLVPDGAEILY